MDGYNNQWSGYGYQDDNEFYQQLQQYATPQQQYPQYSQSYQQPQYYAPQRQPQTQPSIEVVIPSRPPPVQYQQPNVQHSYQYDSGFPSQASQYQQMYQQVPQYDGTMNGYAPAVQQPQRPVQNGVSEPHIPRAVPAHVPSPAPPATPATPRRDYAQILLVLAEEYIEASKRVTVESEEYFKLISLGLGCIESVLKNFQLPPLREAQVSLAYAQILDETTENYDEAEKALTKAIELCERNNYLDLKYSLILLSVKILFQTKPRAAIKAMQAYIVDMDAYKHIAWLYAFRYELAMLHMTSSIRDIHSAITEIEKIESLADHNNDKAMLAFASAMAGILHLQTAHTEAVSNAQQAVARIRSLQFDPSLDSLPQLQFVTDFIDQACAMRRYKPAETDQKRMALQDTYGRLQDHSSWVEDVATVEIPVNVSSLRELPLQQGGLVVERGDKFVLTFSWCTKRDLEVLAFFLQATGMAFKNSSEKGKSEEFLAQALTRLREAKGSTVLNRKMLECRLLIENAFLQCMKGLWTAAKQPIRDASVLLKPHQHELPKSMSCALNYLNGAVHQGEGNLKRALQVWESPIFDLDSFLHRPTSDQARTPRRHEDLDTEVCRNFAILACMNRLFIIDDESHPKHGDKANVIALLGHFAKSTQDSNISAAQMLVHTVLAQSGIWGTKEGILKAMDASKKVMNHQLIALVLMVMQQSFFVGATDQHGQKCVNACFIQTRSWGNPTWTHVMQGIQAESMRFMGQFDESSQKMDAAQKSWEKLPEGIKKAIDWQSKPAVKSLVKQEPND